MTVLAWLTVLLALLPLCLTLANLRRYLVPAPTAGAKLSVLIPARDEERNIGVIVSEVLSQHDVEIDLVVFDDDSSDRTPDILRAIDDPRLRVLKGTPLQPGWIGKQQACWTLAQSARHDLMMFVDADVRLAPDACARIAGYMATHPEMAMASGVPRQTTLTWSEQLLLPLIHFLLLGYLPMAIMARSNSVGLGAGCGQLIVARRDPYFEVGGHGAIRHSIHDGIKLPRLFRSAGHLTGLFDPSPFMSCRMYRSSAEVWNGLMKNAHEGMATPKGLPVWTILLGGAYVLPVLLIAMGAGWPAWLAVCLGIMTRLILAMRFRQPIWPAIAHPIGVVGTLVIQWTALVRAALGRKNAWRGREYPAS